MNHKLHFEYLRNVNLSSAQKPETLLALVQPAPSPFASSSCPAVAASAALATPSRTTVYSAASSPLTLASPAPWGSQPLLAEIFAVDSHATKSFDMCCSCCKTIGF